MGRFFVELREPTTCRRKRVWAVAAGHAMGATGEPRQGIATSFCARGRKSRMAIWVAHIGGRVSDEIRWGAEVRGPRRYLCAKHQPLCTCTERAPEGSIKEFPTA